MLKTMIKNNIILIATLFLLVIPNPSIGVDDYPTGFFGWHSLNSNTGKIDGIMLYIVKTDAGPHAIMQCGDGVPVVLKLEGEAPEYHFSINDTGLSKCYKTDYVIELRERDVLMWVDKDKKSHAMILPRNQKGF